MVPDGRKYEYKKCSATDYKSVYPELPELEILGKVAVNCAPCRSEHLQSARGSARLEDRCLDMLVLLQGFELERAFDEDPKRSVMPAVRQRHAANKILRGHRQGKNLMDCNAFL